MYRCFKCRWKLLFPICLAACICFASITVYALSEEESAAQPKVRLPIIMYHSILKTASRTGKFVVIMAKACSCAVFPAVLVKSSSRCQERLLTPC